MRMMKGLHESTVSCYINPFLGIVMFSYMKILGLDITVFTNPSFCYFDWILITIFSVGTVGVQTLKFKALQNDDPANLSHYSYFLAVY
jgi:hypothetical protein